MTSKGIQKVCQDVSSVYDNICDDFSRTRYKMWPSVVDFLNGLSNYMYVLDLGCGNGKNQMSHNGYKLVFESCDVSSLCEVAHTRFMNASKIDMCSLGYRDNIFDACIVIAVFHHLDTVSKRLKALRELHRVLKPFAMVLMTVWYPAKYNINKDALIPWKQKHQTFQRYYHMFDKDEIIGLISNYFEIIDVSFECENWNIIFKKNQT